MIKTLLNKISFAAMLLGDIAMANAASPYISKVYEFCPAPGQFVQVYPEYEAGDTEATMLAKVEEQICGEADGLISLGGFGGYVVFGFDHTVANVKGEYDFKIKGNGFDGSSEPGIVMVSVDANKNGIPDDEWYEIVGSEHNNPETVKNYEITYYRPDENKSPVADPDRKYLVDAKYIKWNANGEESGYIQKNQFQNHSYWPVWKNADKLVFKGTKLRNNAEDRSNNGTNFFQHAFEGGYADNVKFDIDPGFNIEWAVDSEGKSVDLAGADFIKVYTALNQNCGWIGETSTEVKGAVDLHPNVVPQGSVNGVEKDNVDVVLANNCVTDNLNITSAYNVAGAVYSLSGAEVMTFYLVEGENNINVDALVGGMYIVKAGTFTAKIIKK